MSGTGFRYGLNVMKKKKPNESSNRITFTEDDSSSSEQEHAPIPNSFSSQITAASDASKDDNYDASIYGFDEFYDSMKSAEREQMELKRLESKDRRPKYMENLIESAKKRKRDLLLARERALLKKNELEGDDATEKFVTSSYKKHREEVQKAIEDRKEEDEKSITDTTTGMKDFYASMLDRQEKIHQAAVEGVQNSKKTGAEIGDAMKGQDTLGSDNLILEAKKKGLKLELNDNNEIVDQRQVLTAGLNIRKSSANNSMKDDMKRNHKSCYKRSLSPSTRYHQDRPDKRHGTYSLEEIDKQRKEFENRQRLQKEKEFQKSREAALKIHTSRNTTETQVQSARERYLQRKKKAATNP